MNHTLVISYEPTDPRRVVFRCTYEEFDGFLFAMEKDESVRFLGNARQVEILHVGYWSVQKKPGRIDAASKEVQSDLVVVFSQPVNVTVKIEKAKEAIERQFEQVTCLTVNDHEFRCTQYEDEKAKEHIAEVEKREEELRQQYKDLDMRKQTLEKQLEEMKNQAKQVNDKARDEEVKRKLGILQKGDGKEESIMPNDWLALAKEAQEKKQQYEEELAKQQKAKQEIDEYQIKIDELERMDEGMVQEAREKYEQINDSMKKKKKAMQQVQNIDEEMDMETLMSYQDLLVSCWKELGGYQNAAMVLREDGTLLEKIDFLKQHIKMIRGDLKEMIMKSEKDMKKIDDNIHSVHNPRMNQEAANADA